MNNINKLVNQLRINKCKYALITDTDKINYYINYNFHTGERFIGLLISDTNKVILVLNKLFDIYDIKDIEVIYYIDYENPFNIINNIIDGKLTIDNNIRGEHLFKLLNENNKLDYINGDIIDYVKAIKEDDELEKMRIASNINDEVMQKVYDKLDIGISEKELYNYIIDTFNSYPNTTISFEPIVAFGSNGANPHAEVSDRKLQANESIIIDMGCKTNGYCSDMTRTFFINSCPIIDIYNTVKQANENAILNIKPNIKFSEIDKVARDIISNKGYNEYFTHRLGHGIGTNVHEPFDVSGSNDILIKANMCFSIEPGIYIKDKYGVRIEDLVIATNNGYELLNKFNKELMIKKVEEK